jgi:hypothetical protein
MSTAAGLGRWVTRLFSATVLVLLLAGAPWGLATQIGWPLPRTLPTTIADAQRVLTTPVTDQMVINLLAVAMWIIWAAFAVSVIAEVPARVRGVSPRRVPVIAPIQHVAGWLMSGMAAGVIAAAAIAPAATGASPPPSAAVHTIHTHQPPSVVSTGLASTTTADQTSEPVQAQQQPPTVCAGEHVLVVGEDRYAFTVQRNHSLWRIAELCLGEGARWPEIWELNKHRHFPTVGGRLHDPDLIYPGWDLYLPPGAVPPPDADVLDPDKPAEAAPPPPSPPEPPPPVPPPAATPEASPTTTTSPTPAASQPPQATAGPTGPGAPSAPSGTGREQAEQPHPGEDPGDQWLIDIVLPATAVLATAGLLAALLLARLRQRRGRGLQHRRHGRRLPEPDPAAETVARVAAQPADVTRLDHALRALAAGLPGREPAQLPDIVAAWLDRGAVHLLLAAPCRQPPPPYHATAGETIWTLPAEATLPDVEGQLAPLPALVTIASQPGGQHLLVDLERPGLLTITGDPDRIQDLLRYLAAEAATAQWLDDAEIVLVGFDPEQTEQLIALGEDRIHAATSLPEAVARISRRVAVNAAAIADSGAGSSIAGRVNDIIADAWMPHLLLIADPTAEVAELDYQFQQAGRCAVAVVAAASVPSRWSVHVDRAGRLSVGWLSITDALATRLPTDQLARLARMLQTARTIHPHSPDRPDLQDSDVDEPVPAADDQPWAQGTDQHGHLLDPHPPKVDPGGAPAARGGERGNGERAVDLDTLADPFDPAAALARPGCGQPVSERSPDVQPAHPASADTTLAGATQPAPPGVHPGLQPAVALAEQPHRRPAAAAGRAAAGRRRRAPADPDLDTDLRAWHTADSRRPRIGILGPVSIDAPGRPPVDRPRFHAEIIVYLASRGSRGATADQLDEALWPGRRISQSARRVNITKVRRWLGEKPDGQQWLPPNMGAERLYRLCDGYLLDWHLFRRLRTRGESRGVAGTTDLRRALELVRGAPLDGADRPYQAGGRNPYTWLPSSSIQPHHLASAIVDTAHQLVNLYLDAGDTAAARWAVERAWLADPDRLDDHPWIDLMRITATEGHTSELRTLVGQLVDARDLEVPEELAPDTYAQINRLAGDLLRVG